jgi:hypothetical protein
LSCLAGYSTSILNSQLQLIPTDVNIQPGTSYSWNSTPGPFSPTYSYEILSGERYVETFHLYFFNTNTLAELSCSVSHKDPTKRATLKDFEESTGGRMTLRPDIF